MFREDMRAGGIEVIWIIGTVDRRYCRGKGIGN